MSLLKIADVRTYMYRVPLETPVTSAVGTLHSRSMLLVCIEDSDGALGWGEVWTNFPEVGAAHRARLIGSVFMPLLVGQACGAPEAHFQSLFQATLAQVIQTGETGPFSQCIAGLDQALTDLAARRMNQPIWRFLGGRNPSIKAYASGLGPANPAETALQAWDSGFRHFKLKIGIERAADLRNLQELKAALPDTAQVMVDANQAWSVPQAKEMIDILSDFNLVWLEEPVRATTSLADWNELARHSTIPFAVGENLSDEQAFLEAIESGAFGFLQPDIGKWGGFTLGRKIGSAALAAGAVYCPHWFGGGIGLLASMHLLAAVGGPGLMEVDANPNPLREGVELPSILDGCCTLTEAPGLGVDPAIDVLPALKPFLVQ
jgi:L-alanine-DL-glutamate epimerase-like enolase superfamily enzyme